MDTGEILRRLRQERQILAQLEHPHISRLLDGGNTDDGLPYFVMEYVDGEPIDRYCERLDLSIERRLALFQDVLTAVDYAHRNLVVHRDLKPANILVTGDGTVKLLDFGIAKLLDPERAAEFGATAAPLRLFTLDYASPEQLLGQPLTTASDVYSLGVLLYQLLTGCRPHDAVTGRRQLEQAVCEDDPLPPSQRVVGAGTAAKDHRRHIQGDLDAITLQALQRQEDRRYASVQGLSEDLRRYLQGRPVKARHDTLTYRVGKFLLRHRWGVLSVFTVLAMVITLVTFYTVRLAAERNRAQIEGKKSTQVADFLRGLFEHADPGRVRGPQMTARELLDQGVERIDRELADQPEVQAELMDLMGSVYLSLGLFDAADPLLRRSEHLRLDHLGAASAATAGSRFHRAQWLYAMGDYNAAEDIFLDLLQAETHTVPDPLRANVFGAYGDLLYDQQRTDEAEDLFRRSLALRSQLHGDEHQQVATSLHDLGATLYSQGNMDAAEDALRRALTMRRRLLGEDHPDVATTLSTLGVLRFARQDTEQGSELLAQALAIRRRLYGDGHPLVATTLNNLGELSRRQGQLDDAVTYLSEALEITRQSQGDAHPAYADSLANLARTIQLQGQNATALDLYRQAVEATRRAYPGDTDKLAGTLLYLGDARLQIGQRDAAEIAYLEALDIRRRLFPAGHWKLSFPLLRWGRSQLDAGHPETAATALLEAFEIRQTQRPDHWRTAEAQGWLGSCRFALGHTAEGHALLTAAAHQLRQLRGDTDAVTLDAEERLRRMTGASAPHAQSSSSSLQ